MDMDVSEPHETVQRGLRDATPSAQTTLTHGSAKCHTGVQTIREVSGIHVLTELAL